MSRLFYLIFANQVLKEIFEFASFFQFLIIVQSTNLKLF